MKNTLSRKQVILYRGCIFFLYRKFCPLQLRPVLKREGCNSTLEWLRFFDNSLNCFSTTTFQSAAEIYHAAVPQFPNTFILSMDAIRIEYNDHVENVNIPSFLIFTSFPLQFFLSNRRNFDILKKEMRKEMCWFSNVTFRTIQKKITRFGCRIKKKIIWSKFARAFIFFLSSEKCGSKIMWLNFQGTIFKQAFEERSELIKLFVIHTRSLFFAMFVQRFHTPFKLYYVFRGRLPIMLSSNSKSVENQNRASFRISYIVTRAYSLEISRAISTNLPPPEVLTFLLGQNRRIVTNSKSWKKKRKEKMEESVCSEVDKYLNKFNSFFDRAKQER